MLADKNKIKGPVESRMSPLRKKSDAGQLFGRECVVDYAAEVTEEQVRQADEYVRKEFEDGDWITVEQES